MDTMISSPSQRPRAHTFRTIALGVTGLMGIRAATDDWSQSAFDPSDLLMRIAIAMASSAAFTKAADKLFDTFCVSADGEQGLPADKLPSVLHLWGIPQDQLPLFWALIRKQSGTHLRVMSKVVNRNTFRTVFIKALRRLRDRYNPSHRVARRKFITLNQRRLVDEYVVGECCGSGSYGTCYWATNKAARKQRVCKKILKSDVQLPGEEIPKELDALQRLDHPGILKVFEWFESEESFELILEAARGGDLRHLISVHRDADSNRPAFEESFVRAITKQSCQALAYMHGMRIIHRDVKPANMLLTTANLDAPRLLMADFGLAEFCEAEGHLASDIKGTVFYMAPEVFTSSVTSRTDIWALGVVLFEMFSGERPFKAQNVMMMYDVLRRMPLDLSPLQSAGTNEMAVSFIARTLVKNEADRIGTLEALEDPWCALHHNARFSTREGRKAKRSILSYVNASHFTKVAMNAMAAQIDTATVERLAQAFMTYDIDCDGHLSSNELSQALVDIGIDNDSVIHVAESLDVNCDGRIDYSEFVSCLLYMQDKLLDDVLHQTFHIFDADGDGSLSLAEMYDLVAGGGPLGAILPDGKTVEMVFDDIDVHRDGRITLQELRNYIRQQRQTDHRQEVVNPSASILNLVQSAVTKLGHSREEARVIASGLTEQHWLYTAADLVPLRDSEWARLALPVNLESLLRNAVAGFPDARRRSRTTSVVPDSPKSRVPVRSADVPLSPNRPATCVYGAPPQLLGHTLSPLHRPSPSTVTRQWSGSTVSAQTIDEDRATVRRAPRRTTAPSRQVVTMAGCEVRPVASCSNVGYESLPMTPTMSRGSQPNADMQPATWRPSDRSAFAQVTPRTSFTGCVRTERRTRSSGR